MLQHNNTLASSVTFLTVQQLFGSSIKMTNISKCCDRYQLVLFYMLVFQRDLVFLEVPKAPNAL